MSIHQNKREAFHKTPLALYQISQMREKINTASKKPILSHHVERIASQEHSLTPDLLLQHMRSAAVLPTVEIGLGQQVFVAARIERIVVGDGRADVRHATERGPGLRASAAAGAGAVAEAGTPTTVQVQ